jgi:hypothetical protein
VGTASSVTGRVDVVRKAAVKILREMTRVRTPKAVRTSGP